MKSLHSFIRLLRSVGGPFLGETPMMNVKPDPEAAQSRYHSEVAAPKHPPLVIRQRDEERLYEYAIGSMLSGPREAGGLLDELTRAEVRADSDVPSNVIGLGSEFACQETDGFQSRYQFAQLVAPEQADPALARVSIVSDLGAAVVGLATGQSITWPDRRGRVRLK